MSLTLGDKSVVSSLRYQFGDKLIDWTDEQIAKAWRNYSLSEDYDKRHEEPDLLLLWKDVD